MKIIKNITDWQNIRKRVTNEKSIGFVPTMGCLHQGHAALIQQAVNDNDITVLSIFVNPTQFNDPNDYQHYPIDIDNDLAAAAKLHVDYVLLPEVKAIYPDGHMFAITPRHPLAAMFEGKHRPGHFAGMLTVIMKFFQLVRPARAYFGEKDYQQCVLVETLVKDFFLPIEIIMCPTVRHQSGLPYSSRNSRLSTEALQLAEHAHKLIKQANSKNLPIIIEKLNQLGVTVDYLDHYHSRIFAAIRIGAIRLIDNFFIEEKIEENTV